VTLDPRIRDLLERYPLDLADAELAELRAAAEADPRIDAIMDGMLEADDLLDAAPAELSEAGRDRLDSLVSEALDAKGWSADLATPAAKADPGSNVVDLASRRRVAPLALLAIAAALVVAAVLVLQAGPGDPEFQPRGVIEELEGTLWIMGEARIEDGAERSVSDAVTFRGVLEGGSASLVLLETQGGATHVIWPAAGAVWGGDEGPNPVGAGGVAAPYRPAKAGRAEYDLVAATPAPSVGSGPVARDAVVEQWGGKVLDRVAIEWRQGE